MELNQLTVLFDSGALKSVLVTLSPMGNCYMLTFTDKENKTLMMTAQRSDSREPRLFKSLDAAVGNANKIGFKKIQVEL